MNVSGIEIGVFVVIGDNSQKGDYKVELCIGKRIDGRGQEPFLFTNGGPILITPEDSPTTCAISAAAKSLGLTDATLRETVLQYAPDIDW
jgi:hypothetical protein